MADAINFFKQYSKQNPQLEYNFNQLKMAFQYLEGNNKLLKPLYRTTRRQRTVITGQDIESNLRDFFATIFDRNNIEFTVDDSFRKYELFTFESIIKPVFINIINNAIYWLIPVENRRIHITCKGCEILILNNGEKIDDRYLEDIFILFFTRKKMVEV